ncbi:uncharacterized protein LOC129568846 isoform X1 [Sitodiplosis mosellana]|uniref:uncharacterized protein LOC129568846 isoform X1 n=1 Tax=Sitodiplosis mosellana TaxID=263140 RepID=UPI0024449511|nr:uncharacterized protein LOC129568846 isoform X1 [Sitodiplosis mosellana]
MSHSTNCEKKEKMGGKNEQKKDMADAGPSNADSPPKIFKLTIDCFDEIFEYLSMKDLHSLGQTCKTMQKVAGVYFKQNFSAAEKFCHPDGIYTVHSSRDNVINERIPTLGFNEFMPCISHYHDRLEPLEYLQLHIDEFAQSTNHIYLVDLRINPTRVEFIEKLLPKIEIIQIRSCSVNGCFYELILKHCPNLHTIYVQNADTYCNGNYGWMLQDYPMLKHLELMPRYSDEVDELYGFLERHPKVQRFSTSGRFLWFNRNRFLKSTVKLDILEVKSQYFYQDDGSGTCRTIWDLLSQLHKQGFYKRLFVYTDRVSNDLSGKLIKVPGLELLCIRWFDASYNLPLLTDLKELIILDGLNVRDAEILANSLVKLERLYVDNTTIDCIQPFIRQSTKLNKINLFLRDTNERGYNGLSFADVDNDAYSDYSGHSDGSDYSGYSDNEDEDYDRSENGDGDGVGDGVGEAVGDGVGDVSDHDGDNMDREDGDEHSDEVELEAENRNNDGADEAKKKDTSDWRVLDLVAINKERAKLSGARKITIYVRDDIFLATKWTVRHGDINLSLIEMKRTDSLEWNHHF